MADRLEFAELLRAGILEIQRQESRNQKKFLKDIHLDLARSINRNTTTIEHYLKGHVPTAKAELEQLAKEIFVRGHLNKEWLKAFLDEGRHPNASVVLDELMTPGTHEVSNLPPYLYKRLSLHTYQKIFPLGRCISTTQIEIKVTSNTSLESVLHRFITDNETPAEPMKLQFKPGQRSDVGTIAHRILKNTDDILVWMIDFNPPLKLNQKASYTYVQTRNKWHSWTYEDCEKLHNAGMIIEPLARARWTVVIPVEDFKYTIEFPPNYTISLPSSSGFGVYLGLAEELKEKTRLVVERSFSANYDQVKKQWFLELHVKNARPGLQYEIQWIPPLKEQIPDY